MWYVKKINTNTVKKNQWKSKSRKWMHFIRFHDFQSPTLYGNLNINELKFKLRPACCDSFSSPEVKKVKRLACIMPSGFWLLTNTQSIPSFWKGDQALGDPQTQGLIVEDKFITHCFLWTCAYMSQSFSKVLVFL